MKGRPAPMDDRAAAEVGTPVAQDSAHRPAAATDSSVWSQASVMLVLIIAVVYCLLPVAWLVVASTKTTGELYATRPFALTDHFASQWVRNLRDTLAYQNGIYLKWVLNTLVYSGGGALGATIISSAAGYAMAKFDFPGRGLMRALVFAGVLLPMIVITVPLYLMMSKLSLVNTVWAVLLPSFVSPFGVFLCSVYTTSAVPDDLLESARLDGAGEFRIFVRIVVPLLTPALTTVFLFQFVAIWNNYLLPLIMLNSDNRYPVTVGLTTWQSDAAVHHPNVFAFVLSGTLLAVIPIVVCFLSLQRYWRAGLAQGAVKL